MNIQGWFPLRLTGLISLLSKQLSRVFSGTTVWKHQFFGAQPSLWSNPTSIHDYWKNHGFDYMDLCRQIYYLVPIFSHCTRKATWQVRFPRAKSLDTNVNSDKNLDIFRCCFPQPLQHALIQINGCQSLWGRPAMHRCRDDRRFIHLGTQPPFSHWVLDLKTGPEIMPFYWNSYPQPPGCPSLASSHFICWSLPLMAAHLSCPCDAMFY